MSEPELVSDFLEQTELWLRKDGWVRIDTMDVQHRRRSAQFLLRKARHLGQAVVTEKMVDEFIDNTDSPYDYPEESPLKELMSVLGAPDEWMRGQPLFQRLIQDGADPDEYLTGRWKPRQFREDQDVA